VLSRLRHDSEPSKIGGTGRRASADSIAGEAKV
jgi:hypothetical protein